MTGNRTVYQDIIFVRKYFNHFQALDLNPFGAHTSRHAHALEHSRGIGRVTDRSRSPLPVVLAVRLLADTVEAVAFYNALEPFALSGADHVYFFTFRKNIYGNSFA